MSLKRRRLGHRWDWEPKIENLRGKNYCLLDRIRVWKKNYVVEGKRLEKNGSVGA